MCTYQLDMQPVQVDSADERARGVLQKTKQQIGMIPNMYAYMANAPELLETYAFGYERFRHESGFTPAEQEVIFLTISFENACEYCMAAHSVVADTASQVPGEVTEAIRWNTEIPDPRLRVLATFTRAMLSTRGRPSREDVAPFLAAGFTEKQVLDIILAIGVKTLSNYANHVLATPLDAVFRQREWVKPLSRQEAKCSA